MQLRMLLQKNIFLLVKNLKQMQRTINNLFKRDIAANRRLENSLIFKSLNLITNINFALVKNNGQLLQWFLVVESLSATYELHRCTSIILILFLLSVIPNIIYSFHLQWWFWKKKSWKVKMWPPIKSSAAYFSKIDTEKQLQFLN